MHIYDISEYAHILCTDKYIIFTELELNVQSWLHNF